MLTLSRYARIASAAYEKDKPSVEKYLGETDGLTKWSVRDWKALQWHNGFQGAILENDQEIVCAYKGSTFGKAFVDDWLINDVLIAINGLPPQMLDAYDMALAAMVIGSASSKPVSLVGHSLGGALAQIIGYILALPFVTFNAPGMKGNADVYSYLGGTSSRGNIRGFNMILWSDPVGNYGRHLGKTERFLTPGVLNPFGGDGVIAHQMGNVLLKLQQSAEWAEKTLEKLV